GRPGSADCRYSSTSSTNLAACRDPTRLVRQPSRLGGNRRSGTADQRAGKNHQKIVKPTELIGCELMNRLLRAFAILLCFGLAGVEFLGAGAQAQQRSFDHFMTGSPLTGSHYSVDCTSCHVNGRFKGTPRQCIGCHNGGIAPGQRGTHGPTTANCEACHTTATWVQVRFNHNQILGACASCHNGTPPRAKPPT